MSQRGQSRGANGAGYIDSEGYRRIYSVDKQRREHLLLAEKALGHSLPVGAQVHHLNGDKADNNPDNLIVCPDQAYHSLLHRRQRAFDICGHYDWIKCGYCGQYDSPNNMYIRQNGNGWHRECKNEYERKYRAKMR